MNLDELRKRIDATDASLVDLLNERIRDALEIGKLKNETDQEIYVPVREKAVFDRVVAQNQGPLEDRAVTKTVAQLALQLIEHVVFAAGHLPAFQLTGRSPAAP